MYSTYIPRYLHVPKYQGTDVYMYKQVSLKHLGAAKMIHGCGCSACIPHSAGGEHLLCLNSVAPSGIQPQERKPRLAADSSFSEYI